VEIGHAGLAQTVVLAESDFGGNSSDRRRHGRHCDAGEIADRASTGQDEDRPLLVRLGRPVEPDPASLWSSGQSATLSQAAGSSSESGYRM
jgi:hypothetical protein